MVKSILLATLVAQLALVAATPTQILGRNLGGKCSGPHGKGIWQHADDCKGISLPEKTCPKDKSGVQCCVEIKCQADGGEGMCRSVKENGCSKGEFHPGACPGNDDIQCCIKDCEDEPEPEPASTTCTEEQPTSEPTYPASETEPNLSSATETYPTSESETYPASETETYPSITDKHHSKTKHHTKPSHTKSHSHTKSGKPTYTSKEPKPSHTKSTGKPTYTDKPKETDKPKPKPKPKADSVGKKILAKAMKAKGTPYAWGGGSCKGPSGDQPPYDYGDVGFDCSGLVCWALCQTTGRDLFKVGLRNTHAMYCASEKKLGYKKYKYADRKAGDAVFFGGKCSCDDSESIHHVGLVMENKNNMFNAPNDRVNKAQVNSIPEFGEKPCPYVIRFTE